MEGYRSGRPALLTEKQRSQLGDMLDSGPVAYALDSGMDLADDSRPNPPSLATLSTARSTLDKSQR